MCSNEIIITIKSSRSQYMEDVINSNTDFLNSLFKINIQKNEVSKEAMQSYYVNFYQQHISKHGFVDFMHHFYTDKSLITNIEHALYNLECPQNLFLFNQVMHFIDRINQLQDISYLLKVEYQYKEKRLLAFFSKKFELLQKKENLIEKNHHWLIEHPKLTLVQEHNLRDKLLEVHLNILERYKKENPTHVQIIKELCQKANQTYKCITAGDPHNIYNSSWYFMTESGNYYMVEKNKEAKMYSSKTKTMVSEISTKPYYEN